MPSRLKVFYLHNVDGRNQGMIAATSKTAVRSVIRMPPSEMREASHAPEAQALALAAPGVLFVAPIIGNDPQWVRRR